MMEVAKGKLIAVLLVVSSHVNFAQGYLLPNEKLIFGFETQKGKRLVLAKDKDDEYIIYRFGTKSKIEFEFPEKTRESWGQFKYSFYLRGGGVENEGKDLNYVTFVNGDFEYVIYDTYEAVENASAVGIEIINKKTKKRTDVRGNEKTRKGNLVDFRFNGLLEIDEE